VLQDKNGNFHEIKYWKYDSVEIKPYGIVFENKKKPTKSMILRSDDNQEMFIYYKRLFEMD
jgi:hypothetical protein